MIKKRYFPCYWTQNPTYSYKIVNKNGPIGGKWLIYGPINCKDNQSQSLNHPCILSQWGCKRNVGEFHSNDIIPMFPKKVRGQKHPWEVCYYIQILRWKDIRDFNCIRRHEGVSYHVMIRTLLRFLFYLNRSAVHTASLFGTAFYYFFCRCCFSRHIFRLHKIFIKQIEGQAHMFAYVCILRFRQAKDCAYFRNHLSR